MYAFTNNYRARSYTVFPILIIISSQFLRWPSDRVFFDAGHQTSFWEEPRVEAHRRTVRIGLGRTEHTEGPRSRTSGVPTVAWNVRVSKATEFQRSGRARRTGNAAKDIEIVQVRIRYCGPEATYRHFYKDPRSHSATHLSRITAFMIINVTLQLNSILIN